MKNIARSGALIGALSLVAASLAGCATTGSTTTTGDTLTLAQFEADVQAYSVAACALAPTAASIADTVLKGGAATTAAEVEAVGAIICAAAETVPPVVASHRLRAKFGAVVTTHAPVTIMLNGQPVVIQFQD